jgi:hypothetical protein
MTLRKVFDHPTLHSVAELVTKNKGTNVSHLPESPSPSKTLTTHHPTALPLLSTRIPRGIRLSGALHSTPRLNSDCIPKT